MADYQCITDRMMLTQLTGVHIIPKGSENMSLITPLPLNEYNYYRPSAPVFKDDWLAMLPRDDFQKWFYALFFRLALPYNVSLDHSAGSIFSPLNLTVLFRLMDQLRSLYYPSHWMSEILMKIVENKVVSSCRPPRTTSTSIAALKAQRETRSMCTIPFSYEMATLTRIFMPLLPFIPTSATIPAQKDIYRYTFPLPTFKAVWRLPNNLTLIF